MEETKLREYIVQMIQNGTGSISILRIIYGLLIRS